MRSLRSWLKYALSSALDMARYHCQSHYVLPWSVERTGQSSARAVALPALDKASSWLPQLDALVWGFNRRHIILNTCILHTWKNCEHSWSPKSQSSANFACRQTSVMGSFGNRDGTSCWWTSVTSERPSLLLFLSIIFISSRNISTPLPQRLQIWPNPLLDSCKFDYVTVYN